MVRNFKKIKAWEHADHLAISIYKITDSFPKEELYGITSQLRRAAVSVPTNIVEGSSRGHLKEYLRFLYIARGSLFESKYLIHFSRKLGYLTEQGYEDLEEHLEETSKTLHGLIQAVKKEA